MWSELPELNSLFWPLVEVWAVSQVGPMNIIKNKPKFVSKQFKREHHDRLISHLIRRMIVKDYKDYLQLKNKEQFFKNSLI